MSFESSFTKVLEANVLSKQLISFKGRDGEAIEYPEVLLLIDGGVCVSRSKELAEVKVGDIITVPFAFAGRAKVWLDKVKVVN